MPIKPAAYLVVLFVLSTVATAIFIKSDRNSTDHLLLSSSQLQKHSNDRPRTNLSTSSDDIEELSIDHFCTKVLNQVEAVFKMGHFLLMTLDDNYDDDKDNKCSHKQCFLVYNWKSGQLCPNKSILLEDIFEISDSNMLGPLLFVSTFSHCLLEGKPNCNTHNGLTIIMATFRTNTPSKESKVCDDKVCNSKDGYCFLTTKMFKMRKSSKPLLLPQLKHTTLDIDWLSYRGMIQTNWNETKMIRTDLACPRVVTNATLVQYLSAFSIMHRLVWQIKPGVVRLDQEHSEVSVSSLLNCQFNSSIFPKPLKLHFPEPPFIWASILTWTLELLWDTVILLWTMVHWTFYLFCIMVLCVLASEGTKLLWCYVEFKSEFKRESDLINEPEQWPGHVELEP